MNDLRYAFNESSNKLSKFDLVTPQPPEPIFEVNKVITTLTLFGDIFDVYKNIFNFWLSLMLWNNVQNSIIYWIFTILRYLRRGESLRTCLSLRACDGINVFHDR